MKRFFALIALTLLLTGCQLTEETLNQELSNRIDSHVENVVYPRNNTYRTNYSFYLPKNTVIEEQQSSNDIIKYQQERLYLFVDLYSYKYKLDIAYTLKLDEVFSKTITYNENTFDIIIYDYKGEYIVLAANSYARVSSKVSMGYVADVVETMITLLSTVEVDDDVVFAEEVEVEVPIIETIDIFKSKVEEDNIIKEQSNDSE